MKVFISIFVFVFATISSGSETKSKVHHTIKDVNGNVYKIVKIDNQWWMAENLRVNQNPMGDSIKSYFYNDDPKEYGKYGRLYSWNTAMNNSTDEKSQGICPCGWHIPTESDWDELVKSLGGEDVIAKKIGINGDTGFNTYLSGGADHNGKYLYFNKYAMFWSSTATNNERAYHMGISANYKWDKFASMKGALIHVRCIKDKN